MKSPQQRHKKLSWDEEKAIFVKIKAGDDIAREDFIVNNLGLVLSVVKRMQYLKPDHIPLEDVVQEGYIGLIRAVDKYDPEQSKFSTYATWWIQAAVREYLYKMQVGPDLGFKLASCIGQLNRVQIIISQEVGREITLADQIDDERVQHLAESAGLTVKELLQAKAESNNVISLDLELGIDGVVVSTVEDIIPDKRIQVEESVEQEDLLNYILDKLPERDQFIIIHHFGLRNNKQLTLKQISEHLGITGSRVHQIKTNIINELKTLAKTDPNISVIRGLSNV